MNHEKGLSEFWQGRVVFGPDGNSNPGHVHSFVQTEEAVLIRVQFANGDRYNLHPSELIVLRLD